VVVALVELMAVVELMVVRVVEVMALVVVVEVMVVLTHQHTMRIQPLKRLPMHTISI
jgi:hypothetical protein